MRPAGTRCLLAQYPIGRRWLSSTLTAFAALAAACGGTDGAPTPPSTEFPVDLGTPASQPTPQAAGIAFEACALTSGGTDTNAQCANVEVPVDWAAPDGAKMNFFIKRVVGSAPGLHRQVWLLQGGPGGAGDGLEPLAADLAAGDASIDVYIPDHRGTGRSALLDCPATRGRLSFDYRTCLDEVKLKWGANGLAAFNTTNAAKDVGHVIDKTRAKDQQVQVYGVSYGTYWAQRYLQIFPSQPTAVALDSLCQAGLCSYMKMGYWFDRVGKKYLSECASDGVCSSKLGTDPVVKVRDAIARAEAGTCSGLSWIKGTTLRQIYTWFIASFELRVLVPATAFRITRCNADDVIALRHFESAVKAEVEGAQAPQLSSEVLGYHISFSELEEDPPISRARLAELLADGVFAESSTKLHDLYDAWPRYTRDALVGQYPSSNVPVLLMNGTLDPQTPQEFAETMAPHYTGPAQSLVLLPRAAHGVIFQSPIAERPSGLPACGMTVWHQFLAHPNRALDTSCRDDILPLDFDGGAELAAHFFDRGSLWEATPAPVPSSLPAMAKPSDGTRRASASQSIAAELHRARVTTQPWLAPRGWMMTATPDGR